MEQPKEQKATAKLQRTGRLAMLVVRLIQAVLVGSLVWAGMLLAQRWGASDALTKFISISSMLRTLGVFLLSFPLSFLMDALRRDRTPFTGYCVRQLRRVATILGGLAALQLACDLALSLNVWFVGNNMAISYTVFDLSTLLLAALALTMYGISLVFAHGVALQQQSDETL